MKIHKLFRYIALISYFGLMISLLVWITLAPHTPDYPTAAMLIIAIVPLLFPLRGILYARPYTHAWTSFLMLFYFSHSVGEIYSTESTILYPLLTLIFSVTCFCACIIYIKTNAKFQNQSHNTES